MSHRATKWAFDQPEQFPDMKPNEWAVLVVLADCHNPVNGCFPSVEYLCSHTNLSERSVRDQLVRLRDRGLVIWEEARTRGHRDFNRYTLAFEDGFQPANLAASPTGKSDPDQPANLDESNRQILPVSIEEPVSEEPVIEPDERDARAREDDDHVPDQPLLDKLIAAHPNASHDRMADIIKPWVKLTRDKRRKAVDLFPQWLAEKGKRQAIAGLPTYLADEMFERVKHQPLAASTDASKAPAFDRLWYACFIDYVDWAGERLLDRKSAESSLLRRNVSSAKSFSGPWPITPAMRERVEALAATLQPVDKGSAACEAWARHFQARGAELPIPDKASFLYLPSLWPPAETAARAPEAEDIEAALGM